MEQKRRELKVWTREQCLDRFKAASSEGVDPIFVIENAYEWLSKKVPLAHKNWGLECVRQLEKVYEDINTKDSEDIFSLLEGE